MKYLEKAIRFSIKNWMLILPLFVLTALANLIGGIGSSIVSGLTGFWGLFKGISGPGDIIKLIPAILSAFALTSGIWAVIFQFVTYPTTYGLVNKQLETGSASLNDIGAAISSNFVKYIMYFIGTVVVNFVIGIACTIVLLILSLLVLLLKGFGVFLLVIVALALFVAFVVFSVLISMWFAAMVVDGLDVVGAFKKSIEIVRGMFWTILGITVLVSIAASIAGAILGFLNIIPLLGPIIYSVVPTAQTFIMIVFLLTVYREYTGRTNID